MSDVPTNTESSHSAARRLVVVLPSLVGGGAERVATDLANHWSQSGWSVILVTIDALQPARYPLHQQIETIGLGLKTTSRSTWQALRNNWRRVHALRRELRRLAPAAVVSFTDVTNVTTLLASRGLPGAKVVCERTDPRHHAIGRVWETLRRMTYGRASRIVVQTDAVAGWARGQGWKTPICVIPNAVPGVQVSEVRDVSWASRDRVVIGLGRLSAEKGFSDAVAAFTQVTQDRLHDWRLEIYGEGPERERLLTQIHDKGMSGRIQLMGWTSDVADRLGRASLLVLPSRYEGFPNALLEAMAAGVPVVAYDCESGPREIVRHEVDGLLVPPQNVSALGKALAQLMSDDAVRESMGSRAREVKDRFSRERVFRLWDELLPSPRW